MSELFRHFKTPHVLGLAVNRYPPPLPTKLMPTPVQRSTEKEKTL